MPPAPIIAKSTGHLRKLVKSTMAAHGPACDLNHIDVSRVEDFSTLFKESEFNGDVSQWDVSNATSFVDMFADCTFSGDLSRWRIDSASYTRGMIEPYFKGVLPIVPERGHALAYYCALFKDEGAFDQYLEQQPFGQVHADIFSSFHVRPVWLNEEDYVKTKHVFDIAESLGLSDKERSACILQAHAAQFKPAGEPALNIGKLLDM